MTEDRKNQGADTSTYIGTAVKLLDHEPLSAECRAAMSDLCWKTNMHPELFGCVKTLTTIQSIIITGRSSACYLTGSIDSDNSWDEAIGTILEKLDNIVAGLKIGKSQKERIFRLQQSESNPLYRKGATDHGLHYFLWDDLPKKASAGMQSKWLALKAQLLRAHIRIMEHDTAFEDWLTHWQPREGYWQSIYDVCGRFARRFVRPEPEWLIVLILLPNFVTSAKYIRRVRALRRLLRAPGAADKSQLAQSLNPIRDSLLEALASIEGFLLWGEDPEQHHHKRSPRQPGDHEDQDSGSEPDDDLDEDEDEIDSGTTSRQYLPVDWRMGDSRRQKLLDLDDAPEDYLLSTGIEQAEAESSAARLCGGSIEAANQLLPYSIDQPTIVELVRLLGYLDGLMENPAMNIEDANFAALISTIVWSGTPPKTAASVVAYCRPSAEPFADLSVRFAMDRNGYPCLPGVWRIRALELKYCTTQPALPDKARLRATHFELADYAGASRFILKLLSTPTPASADSPAFEALHSGEAIQVFSGEQKALHRMLRTRLRDFSPAGRLTADRLSKIVFQRIVETSGGDLASAAIATRTDHYLASVRRFYATPTVKHLRMLHAQAFESIMEELTICGWTAPTLPVPSLSPSEESVGSRLCATLPALNKALVCLKDTIKRQLALSDPDDIKREFVIKHNAYTLYTVWAFCLSVGMRGVRTPYVHPSTIDPKIRLVTIADKDNGTDYKRRLCIVLEPVYQQMQFYEQYLEDLDVHGLPKGSLRLPCYFIKLRKGKFIPVEVRPATIKLMSKEFFPFPPNFGRRIIRTELSELGVAPEYLDSWMGHWFRGEEPFGPFSTFAYSKYIAWLQASDSVFSKLFKDFGFEPYALEAK